MRDVSCPSCKTVMEKIPLTNHAGLPLHIDACWPCHLIWFDHLESAALSSKSVIALFRRIHAMRDAARNPLSLTMRCVVCADRLLLTNDIQKSGRFTYHRCPGGHGRISSVAQFLREKKFVRTLGVEEIKALAIKVQQVKCSSCGGPIDLHHDTACTHCGAAIAVLDAEAVEKALADLANAPQRPQHRPDDIADAVLQPRRRATQPASFDLGTAVVGADLLEVGIAALVAAFLS